MDGLFYWENLNSRQFLDLPRNTIAVLPLGATEQHGPHLSVSVDSDILESVIRRTVLHDGLCVLVLPTMRITKSGEHGRHAGTLSLAGDTLLAVLRDIASSVRHAGIERFCLFNGHGGNTAVLEIAVRDMRISQHLIAVHCSWFGFAETSDLFDPRALLFDLHAGDVETSAMLAAAPHKVDMSHARQFRSAMADLPKEWIGLEGQAARPGWIIDDLNVDGACGDAASATLEKGERLLASAARNFGKFLSAFAEFDHRKE